MNFETWQWALALFAAALVGLSKTGISGLGLLPVVLFAQIIPAKEATGLVLPLLCVGDVAAVLLYRRHALWQHLWRLFPWTALGVFAGYLALGRINEQQTRWLIGGIVLGLVALHLFRRWRGQAEATHAAWFPPMIGVLAGFTTLVANAAGPLMVIYLLAMRLPKLEFMGTGAVFFMLLNWFKVPFMVHLGLITPTSLGVNAVLAPVVIAGAWMGRKVLHRINQRIFENLALALSTLAALELIFKFSSHLRMALASLPIWRA
jgi:uncharacterized membrane protein YfcA